MLALRRLVLATAVLLPACRGDVLADPAAGAVVPAPASGEFEALTYNIAGLPRGISKVARPDLQIPQISPRLNAYDLVLVQEDFAYHDALVAEAEHLHRSTPMAMGGLATDGLNRLSRFPFGEFTRERWPECHGTFKNGGDCFARKGFSFARTEVAAGVSIDIYNLHGEAGHSPPDNRAKAANFARLAAFVTERSTDRAIVLGGDFNLKDPRDGDLLRQLRAQTGLEDVSRVLSDTYDRIDRFFFRSGGGVEIAPLCWGVPDGFVDADGGRLSDHDPLAVRFSWRRVPGP